MGRSERKRRRMAKRRRMLIAFCVVVGLVVIGAGVLLWQWSIQPPPPPLTVRPKSSMPVWSGVGKDAAIIGQAESGRKYRVVGRDPSTHWVRIDFDGKTGWLNAVASNESTVSMAEIRAEVPVRGGHQAVGDVTVPGLRLSLWPGPERRGDIIGVLSEGDKFVVLGRHEKPGWFFVEADGKRAWVFNEIPLHGTDRLGEARPIDLPLITESGEIKKTEIPTQPDAP